MNVNYVKKIVLCSEGTSFSSPFCRSCDSNKFLEIALKKGKSLSVEQQQSQQANHKAYFFNRLSLSGGVLVIR